MLALGFGLLQSPRPGSVCREAFWPGTDLQFWQPRLVDRSCPDAPDSKRTGVLVVQIDEPVVASGEERFPVLEYGDCFRVLTGDCPLLLGATIYAVMQGTMKSTIAPKKCASPDGVPIVYSVAGSGEPALLFIHGGLANRTFWDGELMTFASQHRVIAPDLPGHGESGMNRQKWGIPEFGADVRAVIEAEHAEKVILFGNSLGGPVAIEAALLMPEKVLGVVGVDTFQSLTYSVNSEDAQKTADAFRDDYAGSLRRMVRQLFHQDADPSILADAEQRMAN